MPEPSVLKKIVAYWEAPWEVAPQRVPHERNLAKFIERKGKQGWKFLQVLKWGQDPVPTFNEQGEPVRTYTVDCLFRVPRRVVTFQASDRMATMIQQKLGSAVLNIS